MVSKPTALGITPVPVLFHVLFALAYLVSVISTLKVDVSDPFYSTIWVPAGIAVWWAVKCRTRAELIAAHAFVFFTIVTVFHVVEHRGAISVVLTATSHVLAGPCVRFFMAAIDRIRFGGQWISSRQRSPLDRIVFPSDVYRLLLGSFVGIALSKLLALVRISYDGGAVTAATFASLYLRDLAGIITVAGAGLAIFSATKRTLNAAKLLELLIVTGITGVLMWFVFSPSRLLPIVYLVMLPLFWSATRLDVSLATLHAVITAFGASVLGYLNGGAAFAAIDHPLSHVVAIRLFIIMCILLSLVVSTTVQQRMALVADLEALVKTIPDALITVDRNGDASMLNLAGRNVVTSNTDGSFSKRPLRRVNGSTLKDEESPSARSLRGEQVHLAMVKLADPHNDLEKQRIYAVSSSPLYDTDPTAPSRALVLYHDTTEEYRAVKKARQAHEEMVNLFESAPQGIATVSLDGCIIDVNRAFTELLQLPAQEMIGSRIAEITSNESFGKQVEEAQREPGRLFEGDYPVQCADGSEKIVAISIRHLVPQESASEVLLVNAVDITERQELHNTITHMAEHDSLTGLLNRRAFTRELNNLVDESTEEQRDFSLLLIDMDNFKAVNDSFGHHTGDIILIEFAEIFRECVGENGIIGRLGGDEFVVALPDTDRTRAEAIGEAIASATRENFHGRGGAIQDVTVSIGIATLSEAMARGTKVLQLADDLMYQAKHAGRNTFATVASSETQRSMMEILETGAFDIHLQPVYDIRGRRIISAEGLMRFTDPAIKIGVMDFLAAVGRAGRCSQLDALVLQKGISLIPRLQQVCPDFRLSLNISPQSVERPEFPQLVIDELDKHQVKPGSLILEITETDAVENSEVTTVFRERLRERGVYLAIDDFGSGHHHYRSLKTMGFDTIKIDGDFVQGCATNDVDKAIVASIVHLAQAQSMKTVAEYVSDGHIYNCVSELGVDFAQGFHIGAAVPVDTFISTHLVGTHE
ncbi:Cyclic di-GMP phosphodiesterase Gmr [Corynebacterium kalinowskii]|uniref:Cyclic di-GMP phosphodiesterase Gmr n=1 Tax=Corynebacterium kalinowskii TaxID=2675216 RepID=A0A6B8VMN1_9CORY|nr:EAL domain-containing protein [Corynebacterium kalinowskii]QGU00981.1 Cyclic di-GMP phosphodiesterase Gmr [Corynebacterium kalinowskii]